MAFGIRVYQNGAARTGRGCWRDQSPSQEHEHTEGGANGHAHYKQSNHARRLDVQLLMFMAQAVAFIDLAGDVAQESETLTKRVVVFLAPSDEEHP